MRGMKLAVVLWMGCGDKGSETEPSSEEQSTLSLSEQRLQSVAGDLAEGYSLETTDYGEDTAHTLTIYRLKRASSAAVHAPDRAMTRYAFFWDDESSPAEVVDLAANYVYNYWWEDGIYVVEIELLDASFARQQLSFELNGKTLETAELRAGIESFDQADRMVHSCRFNRGMLGFAWQSIEQRIGDGECWTLIDEALRASQAHPAAHYRFGSLLTTGDASTSADWSMVLPGDVIQFDQAYFESADGYTSEAGTPNHTSLVRSLDVDSNSITVYEQNSPIGGPTVVSEYRFDDLQEGGYYLYRAVPIESSPEATHCDQPSERIHAYESSPNQRSSGPVLQTVLLSEAQGPVEEHCQTLCDQQSECSGFALEAEQCVLMSGSELVAAAGVEWHQKIP